MNVINFLRSPWTKAKIILSLGLVFSSTTGLCQNVKAVHGLNVKEEINTPDELKEIRFNAENGDAEAQYQLAGKYFLGIEVPKDPHQCFKWMLKAAEQDHIVAQHAVAGFYRQGIGTPQNYPEALKWYRKAAEKGLRESQHDLGELYYRGKRTERNFVEAEKWFRRAADQGNANAQSNLALMYYKGDGVKKDIATAAKWFRKAADQGYLPAQTNLGIFYYKGLGVNKDIIEAEIWLRKAAEQGNVKAQKYLDEIYSKSLETTSDQLEEFNRTFKYFPYAFWYACDSWMKKMNRGENFDNPQEFAIDNPISNVIIEDENKKGIIVFFKMGFSLKESDEYWQFSAIRNRNTWRLSKAYKIDGSSRSDLLKASFFTISMKPFLDKAISNISNDPQYYKKRFEARYNNLVPPPEFDLLFGESFKGCSFLFSHDSNVFAACSLHQFNGRTPKYLIAPDKKTKIEIENRIHKGNDIQSLSIAKSKFKFKKPLILDISEGPIAKQPVYIFENERPILGFISSKFFSKHEFSIITEEPITALGMSGSPVIDARKGTVIGVLLGAEDRYNAKFFIMESLSWIIRYAVKTISPSIRTKITSNVFEGRLMENMKQNSEIHVVGGRAAKSREGTVLIGNFSDEKRITSFVSPRTQKLNSFGASLAINEKYLLIGDHSESFRPITTKERFRTSTPGTSFLYTANAGELLWELKIDHLKEYDKNYDFGRAVTLSPDIAVVASRERGSNKVVHAFSCSSGQLLYSIEHPKKAKNTFGNKILANSFYLAITQPPHYTENNNGGVVYLHDIDNGNFIHKFSERGQKGFGESLSISESLLLIGATDNDSAAVYLYSLSDKRKLLKLTPDSSSETDFANAVLVDPKNRFIAVSATRERLPGRIKGCIYIYSIQGDLLAKLAVDKTQPTMSGSNLGCALTADENHLWVLNSDTREVFGFQISDFLSIGALK